MKQKLAAALFATALLPSLCAAPFTPGSVVVYRAGDGAAALTSAATAVFLDEYSPAGTLIQSIPMPTTDSGLNQTLTGGGSSTLEGLINRSPNGAFLTVTGFDAPLGTLNVPNTSSTTFPRVIGVVDALGSVDTTTTTTQFNAVSARSAVTTNGIDFWVTGGGSGIIYTTKGSSGPGTVVSTSFTGNLRSIDIFDGQLYVSAGVTGLRLGSVGTGTPNTTGQTITPLPGFPTASPPNPGQFVFADLTQTVAGVDTLYVADDTATTGGLRKYSLVGGNWTFNNTIIAATLRGLTGETVGTTVNLFGNSPTTLFGFTDATGYNQNMTGTAATLATAGANTAFRGLDFSPVPEPSTASIVALGAGTLFAMKRKRRRMRI